MIDGLSPEFSKMKNLAAAVHPLSSPHVLDCAAQLQRSFLTFPTTCPR